MVKLPHPEGKVPRILKQQIVIPCKLTIHLISRLVQLLCTFNTVKDVFLLGGSRSKVTLSEAEQQTLLATLTAARRAMLLLRDESVLLLDEVDLILHPLKVSLFSFSN